MINKNIFPLSVLLSCLSCNSLALDKNQHLAGGTASVDNKMASAFSMHSANMTKAKNILSFNGGNKFFEEPWAQSVGSVSSQDGLGPLFNSNACQNCHVRDGRGHASEAAKGQLGNDFSTLLIRASKSELTTAQTARIKQSLQANVGDACIGGQLQHKAVFGVTNEANQQLSYRYKTVNFADGKTIELRSPIWHVKGISCDIGQDTVLSARVAPAMIGLGLLALIDKQDILARQDIDDANQDGISGKANQVWSIAAQGVTLGRFGWKAGQPSLRQQAAGAFLGDMGITSDLATNENCLSTQSDCLNAKNGNSHHNNTPEEFEVSTRILDKVTFYAHHLAVPIRRNAYAPKVLQGKQLFNKIGCGQCHSESYTTQKSEQFSELSEQKIYPYSDLLLHDMGTGLTDFDQHSNAVDGEIPVEFLAQANEWRTPPLWGIGLAQTVDPKATFLHDGRARTILEAVLWHSGEAQTSKLALLKLDKVERQALLAFLHDL
ncbi:thiol oxidoreductase containing 2 cytochrome c heme-binding sites [Psychromonas ingrahamii 37]|uniref:Thiol oxidoreductase containing 2 cytochrome c heme-binding sites n=1 Tax=Psychromonas ingrahamii (strain DSM 17664 / CCUG 51855 / 37) TaxID=357804 RepID=A1SSS5_PSYIN|nr:di-heme oxidoredictase family protein [Psychromonas ingrahamii]ABM02540.1 thiol oxidoreductase containing 2 cytochrome c heme-binding sites [Psychromonas ingrahamii 37]